MMRTMAWSSGTRAREEARTSGRCGLPAARGCCARPLPCPPSPLALTGAQVSDQDSESAGNAALRRSIASRVPVRVCRLYTERAAEGGSAGPSAGKGGGQVYVYEGLYAVLDFKMEVRGPRWQRRVWPTG
jgi:hypothetical protein